jgi:hypothetical protein
MESEKGAQKKVLVVQGNIAEREEREDGGTNTKSRRKIWNKKRGRKTCLFANAILNYRSSVKEQPDRSGLSNSVGTIHIMTAHL